MSLLRWIPTFLAFPIGGYIAIETLGGADEPLIAGIGGLLVGALVGLAQWLALRSHGIGPAWSVGTALGTATGGAAAVALTDAATSIPALVVAGLVTGVVVGGIQGALLGRGPAVATLWTVVVGLSYGLGWLVTGNVVVDAERGFYSFGASGALVVTLATGLVLRALLGDATPAVRKPVAVATVGTHA